MGKLHILKKGGINILYLTTKNTIYSSHILKNHEGKCGVLHGHQYEIETTIRAEYSEIQKNKCNFLIDFYEFDGIWKKIFPIDHININELTSENNPSVEFLSKWIYDHLKNEIPNLYSIKIYETPTNYCEYKED